MSPSIRNRIKGHRRVRAGDLVPHEWNFRTHPALQQAALEALYQEVGFARSLLAYELPDGRLKLIDGHLRRDLTPDMEVDVEILDVTEEEARKLLLSIDPLAALAEQQEQLHERLLELTPTDSEELQAAWHASTEAYRQAVEEGNGLKGEALAEQFYVLITCRDDAHQREMLARFKEEGLEYNPATRKQPFLYGLLRPLDDLEEMLLDMFAGQTLTMEQIYDRHNIDRPYTDTNYKDVLKKMELAGKITAAPPYTAWRKVKGEVTFADSVWVTFPPKR